MLATVRVSGLTATMMISFVLRSVDTGLEGDGRLTGRHPTAISRTVQRVRINSVSGTLYRARRETA
jgi:hypothetical protein